MGEYKRTYIFVTVAVVMLTLIVLLVVLLTGSDASPKRPKLIIDHDGGADDAMAIFMALLYEKHFNGPNVVALTTVHGNVNEEQVFNNTQRILDIAKRRRVPIYRGSKSALVKDFPSDFYFGYDGLGDNETIEYKPIEAHSQIAPLALIELSKKYKGDLSILAMGSLTNIALTMKLDTDFINRISQLYVAAGNMYSEEHPKPEFNAEMDVEAYRIVTTNGNPEKITIIPYSQITNNINISVEWRLNELGSIPTEIMKAQNVFEQVSLPTSNQWVLLDPAAMAVVLNASSIVDETKYSDNSIKLCGEDRGINTNLLTSIANATTRVVYSVKEEPYKEFLYDIFSSELNFST